MFLFSGTLELAGSHAAVVGVSAIYALWWIAFSVIRKSYLISSDPLPLPKFVMALAQSSISAIAFSAYVMVVRVSSLWIKCTVYVNHSFLVVFMWHLFVQ